VRASRHGLGKQEQKQQNKPRGEDLALQPNYEIHQKLTDEVHVPLEPWDVTTVSTDPERAREVGAVYGEGNALACRRAVRRCGREASTCL
jgi:hypothetical protein